MSNQATNTAAAAARKKQRKPSIVDTFLGRLRKRLPGRH